MQRLVWLAIVLACACSKSNPNYCAGAPQNNCTLADGGPDAPKGCSSAAECAGTADPVCDLAKHQCVQCNSADSNACTGTSTPVCDLTNETCRACAAHSECGAPGACLPDGSCGGDANVAWVMPGGSDTGTCTMGDPCATIGHALAQNRAYIKLATGNYSEQPTIQQNVTILADAGAKLLGVVVGPMVTIKGPNMVAIHDVEITQGPGATGHGIYVSNIDAPTVTLDHVLLDANTGRGIDMQGGNLVVSRSTILENNAGGLFLNVNTFDITNTFIVRNGNASTGNGGAVLVATQPSASRFAFNTVVDNNLPQTTLAAAGVTCDLAGFAAPDNIVARNYVAGSATATNANQAGQCTYPSSIDATAVTNLAFTSPDTAPYDYHLGAGSIAIDQATTAMAVDVDIDGDHRPQGNAKDQGADEYK
ncbi:MAG: choice-of-anchor Q domain-containing protein [Acidobacteriota bacterium]